MKIDVTRKYGLTIKAIGVIGWLSLTACVASIKEAEESRKAAVLASKPQIALLVTEVLEQCESVLRGNPLDRDALSRAGFKSEGGKPTDLRFTAPLAQVVDAFGTPYSLEFRAIIIDRPAYERAIAEGRSQDFGFGCSADIPLERATAFFGSKGYAISLLERGKFRVRKGSVKITMVNEYSIHSNGSTHALTLSRK